MDSGDEQVGIPVVIEVADRHAHVVTCAGQPRLRRYIREHTVTIVTKQAIGELGVVLFQGCEVRAIREEDIRAAVLIVVKDGDASGHGCRQMTGFCFRVLELERYRFELKEDRRWRATGQSRYDRDANENHQSSARRD